MTWRTRPQSRLGGGWESPSLVSAAPPSVCPKKGGVALSFLLISHLVGAHPFSEASSDVSLCICITSFGFIGLG
jgi:hypothetical protein